uniref:tRNA-dihydrouridine(47) synthase [NAD(P)(+)] n=1 Tax=Heterorhabditis bacteriophora TaxID=37862 RepID=A0A1I7WSN7_HETBA
MVFLYPFLTGKPCKIELNINHLREQRYTRLANWNYVKPCIDAAGDIPLWVCGDILSWQDYYTRLEENPIGGIMIARGALIKPWIFTEIDEKRTWDISATERLDLLKTYVNYGLDHWGSDDAGVERTRRFLLEWLSFQCRSEKFRLIVFCFFIAIVSFTIQLLFSYIPVGLLETLPQCINDRPPLYRGRSELETLLSSQRVTDWIEISKMLLGPTPEGFTFIPKHKASSY